MAKKKKVPQIVQDIRGFKPLPIKSPKDTTHNASEITAATFRNRIKSNLVPIGTRLIKRISFPYNGNFWGRRRCSQLTTISLVTIIAVNIEVKIPIARVTENPLIGPEPNCNTNIAALKVVIFASIIVLRARWYPESTADIGVRPLRSSSRMRSNTKTLASTAIPIVSTIPAIPGKVKVA